MCPATPPTTAPLIHPFASAAEENATAKAAVRINRRFMLTLPCSDVHGTIGSDASGSRATHLPCGDVRCSGESWRQGVVDVAGGQGRVPERNSNLMKVGYDIADAIKARYRCALALIDFQKSRFVMLGPEGDSQLRAHLGAHRGIEHVERCDFAGFEDCLHAVTGAP